MKRLNLFSATLSTILGILLEKDVMYPLIGFAVFFFVDMILGVIASIKRKSKCDLPFTSNTFTKKLLQKSVEYFIILVCFFGFGLITSRIPKIGEHMLPISVATAMFLLAFNEIISIKENMDALGINVWLIDIIVSMFKRVFEIFGIHIKDKEVKKVGKHTTNKDNNGFNP